MFQLDKKHQKHPKYKPTNIDWIGDIPDEWKARKLKFGIVRNDGGVWGEDPIDDISGTVVLRSTEQKVDGTLFIENPARRMLDKTEIEKSILKEGDLLITKSSGSSNHIGKTSLIDAKTAELNCCFSNFMQRLRMKKDISSKYIAYALNNPKIGREQLDYLSQSTTGLANLNGTLLGEIIFPSPSFEEQQKIASYLDEKTALIDEAITKKQHQIELLSEHRTALINNAITKGLDPNADMKDSGIEWIGIIPKGWEVKKLKYLGDITLGKMLKSEGSDDDVLKPYLRAQNITWLNVNVDDVKEMYFSENELSRLRLKRGDLLVSEGGEVGRTCIWKDELDECYIQNSVNRVRAININPKIILYLFYVYGDSGVFNAVVNRVSIAHLTCEKLKEIPVVVASEKEQQEIVAYLDKETTYINAMKEKIQHSINLLQEYKTSLISHAVSGKIKIF